MHSLVLLAIVCFFRNITHEETLPVMFSPLSLSTHYGQGISTDERGKRIIHNNWVFVPDFAIEYTHKYFMLSGGLTRKIG
jgi:hypothetical protein